MEVQQDSSSLLQGAHKEGDLYDLVIINKDKEYRVHKHILSTSIPHFDRMFSSRMKESTSKVIKLDHQSEAFDLVIKWSYGEKILITKKNAFDLFNLADYMNISKLTVECLNFLWNAPSDSPLVDIDYWIKQISSDETRKIIDGYICRNLRDFVSTDSFLHYDVYTVDYIISTDALLIDSEMQVFKAILRWIGADEKKRSTHLPDLLKKVHWVDICGVKLSAEIVKLSWMKNSKIARPIIMAALEMSLYGSLEYAKRDDLILKSRKRPSLVFYQLKNKSKKTITCCNSQSEPVSLSENQNLPAGRFNDFHVTEHEILYHGEVIRIDWRDKTYRLFADENSYYGIMYDRLFRFDFNNRKVYLWKGDRSIELIRFPNYQGYGDEIVCLAKHAGSFYILSLEECVDDDRNDQYYQLEIAKFNPCENVWKNVTDYEIVLYEIEILRCKVMADVFEIYADAELVLTYDVLSNTFTEPKDYKDYAHDKGESFRRGFYAPLFHSIKLQDD